MELSEKLQELRKEKGLTQEELAEALFVSRTAISKWESGRGVPNIESLKAISKFFSVSIDELLSGEEILKIADEDNKQKEKHTRDLLMEIMLSRLNERWTILWLCNQMGQFVFWDGQGECVTTTTKKMCFVLIMKDTSMVQKIILSNAKTVRSHSRLDGLTFCDCI